MGRAIRPPRPLRARLNVAGPGLQLLRQVIELAAALPEWQHGNPAPGAARSWIQAHNSGSGPPYAPARISGRACPVASTSRRSGATASQEDRRLPRAQRLQITAQSPRSVPTLVRCVTRALTLKGSQAKVSSVSLAGDAASADLTKIEASLERAARCTVTLDALRIGSA
jgi:hypothetical protein